MKKKENKHLRKKMIQDLTKFVQSLTVRSHEVIVYISTNKPYIPRISGVSKLLDSTELVDTLNNGHDIGRKTQPPTRFEKRQDKIIEHADNYLALQSSLFFK